jgi:2-amino-4-hydroxy-6-hydroxymethyldihydropteridine diphosphokinase
MTPLEPDVLLAHVLEIERRSGRERRSPKAARTIDIDLILYGDRITDAPGLSVPHPRFRQRRFVLEPLAEVAPGWIDPVTGKTVGELLAELGPKK